VLPVGGCIQGQIWGGPWGRPSKKLKKIFFAFLKIEKSLDGGCDLLVMVVIKPRILPLPNSLI